MQTLFENSMILVEKNSSDEIFVKNKQSGIRLGIGDYGANLNITCNNGIMVASVVNGLATIITKPNSLEKGSDSIK